MAEEKKRVDPLQEQVKAYLDKRAAEDQQFAEKYANPKKTLSECVKYLYGEAYKRAAGGKCCYIPPEEVYGLAVHYYDEEDIKIHSLPRGARATTAPKPAEKPAPVLTEDERKRAKAEALAEIKAQAKAEAKQKEKARKEAEKARQREKKEAYRRQLEADGDLFAAL